MKRKSGLFILALLCLSAPNAFAGEASSGAYVSQVSGYTGTALTMQDITRPLANLYKGLSPANSSTANTSYVAQFGSFNSAVVAQSGQSNVGMVVQIGQENTALLQQSHSHQQAFIIQQGAGNFASVSQR